MTTEAGPSEIALLEAKLAHLSAIARCAIGQPDRAERVADRERAREQLAAARREIELTVLVSRLRAFGRDCVLNGDMTPVGERMLNRILEEESE